MVSAPLRPCLGTPERPRCPARVRRGRCRDCAQTTDRVRGTSSERGYTTAWTKWAAALKREFPLCGQRVNGTAPFMSRCHDRGLATPGQHVDHVVPHRGNQDLMWRRDNLQILCAACHSAKTRAGF